MRLSFVIFRVNRMSKREIPTEVLEKIFQHADLHTLKVCSGANRFFAVSIRFINEKAWASYPVGEIVPWVSPMRRYRKVRLKGRFSEEAIWTILYFYDPEANIISHLELSRTVISVWTLLEVLAKWTTVHTLVMRSTKNFIRWPYTTNMPVNRTVKHLCVINADHISPQFQNLETLYVRDANTRNDLNLARILQENSESLKSLKMELRGTYSVFHHIYLDNFRQLEFMHLRALGLFHEPIHPMLMGVKNLRRLHLEDLPQVCVSDVQDIVDRCERLEEIRVVNCVQLRELWFEDPDWTTVVETREQRSREKWVVVHRCRRI